MTYKYTKKIKLPGISIRLLEGFGPIAGDMPFAGNLYTSQRARAFLENLQQSKGNGSTSKTLSIAEVEDKLEQIVRINGEEELNKLKDTARALSETLGMTKEMAILDKLISALLTTYDTKVLTSPLAVARAFGFPYDPMRLQLFEELFRELHTQEFESRQDKNSSIRAFRNFSFFESYFSNFIEGTVFEVEEAKQIMETNQPLPARNEDSHDVLGTYQIVSNKQEMSKTPATADELLSMLQYRHKVLLRARIDKNPGLFKDKNNFAGQTAFVDFNLVKGTLIKSFDFYRALEHPFARAAYMMFVVSEVHPFLDGNGRVARVMMNAELVSRGQSKIIIPNVLREDYLGVLRKLTRSQESAPYIRMLRRAFEFSSNIYGDNTDVMQAHLKSCNAFLEPGEGRLKIIAQE